MRILRGSVRILRGSVRIMMVAMHQAPTRYTTADKNLLFWLRLAAYSDVDVDHRLLNAVTYC